MSDCNAEKTVLMSDLQKIPTQDHGVYAGGGVGVGGGGLPWGSTAPSLHLFHEPSPSSKAIYNLLHFPVTKKGSKDPLLLES